ncbi:MAG TPA: lysylphosphatidylglycerol synthase transmembrane domain-containing protein [Candidatus Nanoarchaeia archaeon]|nr:lysylphosphatidylglycerol synthase transmembrane domain-containing protein [Candidatus Nanoarchaeia archaeon]
MRLNKKLLSICFSVVLGVGLLAFILFKYPFNEVIATFSNVTPTLLLIYLATSFTIMFLFSVRWKFVLGALGHNISLVEAFGYRIIDYGLSYITPSGKAGGEPIRAALLTRKGISFKEGLANVTTDKTIELSVSVCFFVVGLLILAIGHPLNWAIRIFLIVFSSLLIFLIWKFYSHILRKKPVFTELYRFLRLHKIRRLAKYEQAVIEFEKPIIKFYSEERKTFFIALSLSLVSLIISMVEFKVVLLMLGIDASLGVVFMVFSVVGMAFLVPVPMGLGSLEAFQIALFSALGIGSASGVGLAMITRARDMIWVLIGVSLAFYIGSFKTVFKEAYKSIYANPINKITIFRDGRPFVIKMKLFRPSLKNRFVGLDAWKKNTLFFRNKKESEDDESTFPEPKPRRIKK